MFCFDQDEVELEFCGYTGVGGREGGVEKGWVTGGGSLVRAEDFLWKSYSVEHLERTVPRSQNGDFW